MKNEIQYIASLKSTLCGKILAIIFVCLITASAIAQDITNTLAPGGKFIVKDAANNYLLVDQSTGQVNILNTLKLENTTSPSVGVIFMGADRFIHRYGLNNTFIGINSGNFTMTGDGNFAVGDSSLFSNTTGFFNTAVGNLSLYYNTTGRCNTAMGWGSLYGNTSGYWNTALGHQTLCSNTTGYENTAVGLGSLFLNSSGFNNTAMGNHSLFNNTTGNLNTALGYESLYSNTIGVDNTALGGQTLLSNTTGCLNTAVGTGSLASNTTGSNNTAVGYYSLLTNSTGYWNTAVGRGSLFSNTTGFHNTAIGTNSLWANTTGAWNTALGYEAGSYITSGINLMCLGNSAQPSSGDATNQITLGNEYITSLRCNVTTITSLSDARDKKNIRYLNLGIDFLMKIKPRQFNWDRREWYEGNISDGSKMQEAPTAGFIAQELDEAQTEANVEWLNLVLKDNSEKWEATPGNLLPIMVKAMQDLNLKCEELKAENNILKNNNEKLSEEIASLKSMNEKLATLEQMVNDLSSYKQTSFSVAK